MTERVASRVANLCRVVFVGGSVLTVWLYFVVRDAETADSLPFTLREGVALLIVAVAATGASLLVGAYLSVAMGVDVFGLNRLFGFPHGKPFDGLAPGEEERLSLSWTRGSLGLGASHGFKILLTNQRLLAGSSLSSWYLIELPLARVRLVERRPQRWGPEALRFYLLEAEPAHRQLTLADPEESARLVQELDRLGLPVASAA